MAFVPVHERKLDARENMITLNHVGDTRQCEEDEIDADWVPVSSAEAVEKYDIQTRNAALGHGTRKQTVRGHEVTVLCECWPRCLNARRTFPPRGWGPAPGHPSHSLGALVPAYNMGQPGSAVLQIINLDVKAQNTNGSPASGAVVALVTQAPPNAGNHLEFNVMLTNVASSNGNNIIQGFAFWALLMPTSEWDTTTGADLGKVFSGLGSTTKDQNIVPLSYTRQGTDQLMLLGTFTGTMGSGSWGNAERQRNISFTIRPSIMASLALTNAFVLAVFVTPADNSTTGGTYTLIGSITINWGSTANYGAAGAAPLAVTSGEEPVASNEVVVVGIRQLDAPLWVSQVDPEQPPIVPPTAAVGASVPTGLRYIVCAMGQLPGTDVVALHPNIPFSQYVAWGNATTTRSSRLRCRLSLYDNTALPATIEINKMAVYSVFVAVRLDPRVTGPVFGDMGLNVTTTDSGMGYEINLAQGSDDLAFVHVATITVTTSSGGVPTVVLDTIRDSIVLPQDMLDRAGPVNNVYAQLQVVRAYDPITSVFPHGSIQFGWDMGDDANAWNATAAASFVQPVSGSATPGTQDVRVVGTVDVSLQASTMQSFPVWVSDAPQPMPPFGPAAEVPINNGAAAAEAAAHNHEMHASNGNIDSDGVYDYVDLDEESASTENQVAVFVSLFRLSSADRGAVRYLVSRLVEAWNLKDDDEADLNGALDGEQAEKEVAAAEAKKRDRPSRAEGDAAGAKPREPNTSASRDKLADAKQRAANYAATRQRIRAKVEHRLKEPKESKEQWAFLASVCKIDPRMLYEAARAVWGDDWRIDGNVRKAGVSYMLSSCKLRRSRNIAKAAAMFAVSVCSEFGLDQGDVERVTGEQYAEIVICSNARREEEAEMHNRIMHSTNGNPVYPQTQKDIEEAPTLEAICEGAPASALASPAAMASLVSAFAADSMAGNDNLQANVQVNTQMQTAAGNNVAVSQRFPGSVFLPRQFVNTAAPGVIAAGANQRVSVDKASWRPIEQGAPIQKTSVGEILLEAMQAKYGTIGRQTDVTQHDVDVATAQMIMSNEPLYGFDPREGLLKLALYGSIFVPQDYPLSTPSGWMAQDQDFAAQIVDDPANPVTISVNRAGAPNGETCGGNNPVFPYYNAKGTISFHVSAGTMGGSIGARMVAVPKVMIDTLGMSMACAMVAFMFAPFPNAFYSLRYQARADGQAQVPYHVAHNASLVSLPGKMDIMLLLPREVGQRGGIPNNNGEANNMVQAQPAAGPTNSAGVAANQVFNIANTANANVYPLCDYLYTWSGGVTSAHFSRARASLGALFNTSAFDGWLFEMMATLLVRFPPLMAVPANEPPPANNNYTAHWNSDRTLARSWDVFRADGEPIRRTTADLPLDIQNWDPQFLIPMNDIAAWNQVATQFAFVPLYPPNQTPPSTTTYNPRLVLHLHLWALHYAMACDTVRVNLGIPARVWDAIFLAGDNLAMRETTHGWFPATPLSSCVPAAFTPMIQAALTNMFGWRLYTDSNNLTVKDRFVLCNAVTGELAANQWYHRTVRQANGNDAQHTFNVLIPSFVWGYFANTAPALFLGYPNVVSEKPPGFIQKAGEPLQWVGTQAAKFWTVTAPPGYVQNGVSADEILERVTTQRYNERFLRDCSDDWVIRDSAGAQVDPGFRIVMNNGIVGANRRSLSRVWDCSHAFAIGNHDGVYYYVTYDAAVPAQAAYLEQGQGRATRAFDRLLRVGVPASNAVYSGKTGKPNRFGKYLQSVGDADAQQPAGGNNPKAPMGSTSKEGPPSAPPVDKVDLTIGAATSEAASAGGAGPASN